MNRFIGVLGAKRTGKDTVTSILGDLLRREDVEPRRVAFADPLKRTAMALWDLDDVQCYGAEEDKERIDPRYGKSARRLMQELGTEVGRTLWSDTWVQAIFTQDIRLWEQHGLVHLYDTCTRSWRLSPHRRLQEDTIWIVPDVRFPNEAAALRARDAVLLRVLRPGLDRSDSHVSETSADDIPVDLEIHNDGTLDDLRQTCIRDVLPLLEPR